MMLIGIGLLWACSTDEFNAPYDDPQPAANTQTGTASAGTMTFTASMGSQSISKSHVAYYDGHTWFDQEDHIGVFPIPTSGVSQSKKFDYDKSAVFEDKAQAVFIGPELTSEDGFFAMLPYQSDASFTTNEEGEGVITMTLPAEQESVNEENDKIVAYQDLMVGYTSTNNKSFNFKHVGAMLRFATFCELSKIEIEAPEGTMIAGDNVKVTVDKDGNIKSVTGGSTNKVSINLKNLGINTKGDSVLITILPCSVKDLKVTFYNMNKNPTALFPSHTFEEEKTFVSGKMYSYGNVGPDWITCYDTYEKDNEIFKIRSISYSKEERKMVLPTPTQKPEQEGYLYQYADIKDPYQGPYQPNFAYSISGPMELYLSPVKAIKVSIYGKGADNAPTLDTLVYNNTFITLPPIELDATDGKAYGYSLTSDGAVEKLPGERQEIKVEGDAASFAIYAVQKNIQVFNIYGNGAGQEPTFTMAIPKNYSTTIDLPELPKEDSKFGGYSTTPGGEIKFYSGEQPNTNRFSENVVNFYPVYVDYLPIASTSEYNISDYPAAGVGDQNTQGSLALASPLPKIAKGTAAVFKFKNHISANSDNKNVAILLCGLDNANTSFQQKFQLNTAPNNKCIREKKPTTFSNYYNNINGADITVKISNHGGIIDIECSWMGASEPQKSYSVKYTDIIFWNDDQWNNDNKAQTENPDNDIYVSFTVNSSYIEFLDIN